MAESTNQHMSSVQSFFKAGDILVGDDCFIGGDVIILPFRRIGRGCVVGAGSVVTEVSPWRLFHAHSNTDAG